MARGGRWRLWPLVGLLLVGVVAALGPGPRAGLAHPATASLRWNLQRIDAEHAWTITRGSPGVVIGIIDSGIDATHPELAGRVVPGRDFTGGNDTGPSAEHGTFVAGIAAGAGIEVAGVAPGAQVMPLKVINKSGHADVGWVAEAIRYGVNAGARILNLSLRLPRETTELKEAIDYAAARGVLVVCSAGNQGRFAEGAPVQYPANHPVAFAVTSTTWDDKRANYASAAAWVRVAAPGGDYSTGTGADPKLLIYGPVPGGRYASLQGTSFAAPHVAGLAALLWSANPQLSRDEVMQLIMRSADPMGAAERPNAEFGWGRINAWRAVRAALPRDLHVEAALADGAGDPAARSLRGYVADARNQTHALGDLIERVEVWANGQPGEGQWVGQADYGPAAGADTFKLDVDPTTLPANTSSLWVVARTIMGDSATAQVPLGR